MSETQKIICSMVRVGKTHPPKNRVLRDISLSYFYGAKIGVLGLNGSGKSTLLRIMAGVETRFDGETIVSDGYSVGYLEQEPELDDSKTVREVVLEGVQEVVNCAARVRRDQHEIRRRDVVGRHGCALRAARNRTESTGVHECLGFG